MPRPRSPERQKLLAERSARRELRLQKKAAKEEKKQSKELKKKRRDLVGSIRSADKEFRERKKVVAERYQNGEVKVVVSTKPLIEVSSFENLHSPVSLLCKECHQVKKSTEFIDADSEICEMCHYKEG